MKNTLALVLMVFGIVGCSPSPEELKEEADKLLSYSKLFPLNKPCSILAAYKDLESFESLRKTNFYREQTSNAIKDYSVKCDAKKEARKTGNWKQGKYVDAFGDYTDDGYMYMETKGFFSNSATTNSPLRIELFLSNGSVKSPTLRLYEYDSNNPVKGVYSDANTISCRVKNGLDDIFSIGLYQAQGWDYLKINDVEKTKEDVDKLKQAILRGGVAKFSCTKKRYRSDKYNFTLNFNYFPNAQKKYELGTDWYLD